MKTVINKKSRHLLLMVVFFLSACTNLSLPISSPTDSDPSLSQNVLTTPQSSPSVMPHPTEAPTSVTDVVTVTQSPLINDEPIELSLEDIEISTLSFPENLVETNCAAIENSRIGPLALDEQNLYYVVMNEPSNLYRMPLDFSEKSLIYSSTFENGFLNVFPVQLSNNWILFLDSNNSTGSFLGKWKLIAVNLLTNDSVVVTTSEKANTSLLNFYATVSGDTVYWVKNVIEGNELTLPSSIYAYQLVGGIESLVYEETSLDHVVTIPYVSEDYLVFERDPNIGKAPESISIALLDLKSNTLVDLPYESPGSMPQIQYPFILWKNSYRFDQIKSFTYINLLTGQNTKVPFVGDPNSDIHLYGAYPFARTIIKMGDRSMRMMTLVIFDVSNRKAFVVDTGSNNVGIGNVDINSNYIVFNVIPNVGGSGDQTTWLCKMPFPAPN